MKLTTKLVPDEWSTYHCATKTKRPTEVWSTQGPNYGRDTGIVGINQKRNKENQNIILQESMVIKTP